MSCTLAAAYPRLKLHLFLSRPQGLNDWYSGRIDATRLRALLPESHSFAGIFVRAGGLYGGNQRLAVRYGCAGSGHPPGTLLRPPSLKVVSATIPSASRCRILPGTGYCARRKPA